MVMHQKKDESFKSFIVKFNKQSMGVMDLTAPLAIMTLLNGLKDDHFKLSLSKNMADLRIWAEKCVNTKEAMQIVEKIDLADPNPEGTNT